MEAAMHKIWTDSGRPETKYVIGVVAFLVLLSLRLLPKDRQRIGRTTVVFFLCWWASSSAPCSRKRPDSIRASRS